VVVPTYKRDDLLARCLERLAPDVQTFPADRYNVVVTDDAAGGTAQEMIRTRFPWAQWVQGPQLGRSANRNYGASQARRPWIAFVDDDCVPTAHWLEGFAEAFEPGIAVYEGKTTCEAGIPSCAWEAPVNLTGGALWSCNFMIARELFEELGGFDPSFNKYGNEDTDLLMRLRERKKQVKFAERATVDHPPRLRPRGRKAAEQLESVVHVWYKSGQRTPLRARLLKHAISVELQYIARFPFSWESVVGTAAIGGTVLHAARHSEEWQRKYRTQYEGVPGAYPFPLW